MSVPSIEKRIEVAIAKTPRGLARHTLCEAVQHISKLNKRIEDYEQWWFYLSCHPEHVTEVVGHLVFGREIDTDRCGHIITEGS